MKIMDFLNFLKNKDKDKNIRVCYLASGCFWGTEYWLSEVIGTINTTVGYMGGNVKKPTYDQVKTGTTGHVECVKVEYDSLETTYEKVLKIFFETHDFTQTDGQGPDIGSQYLSCIFYSNEEEKKTAEKCINYLSEAGYKVATLLKPATVFWKAEEHHQQYYEKRDTHPYCHSYKSIFK